MAERKKAITTKSKVAKTETKNSLPVYNQEGKIVANFELDSRFFDKKINTALLAQIVRVYQDNEHQGTSKTKTKSEVRGGGRKPWRQKGTGRARAGSIRSAQWRGGGIIFGPTPHAPSLKLNKKMRAKALLEALKLKIKEDHLVIINDVKLAEVKTKAAAQLINTLPLTGKTLVLTSENNAENLRSFRNLKNVKLEEGRNLNPYQVLYYNSLLMSQDALKTTISKFGQDLKEKA